MEQCSDRLMDMQRTEIIGGTLAGYDVWLARTGYTGEPMAFELFVHPDDLPAFWRDLLRVGAAFGLKPCGLAARDSLRIEAGLPLYGHELAGPLDPQPVRCRFRSVCEALKAVFHRQGSVRRARARAPVAVARFQADEEHSPMLGQSDVIVNAKGRVVGYVTLAPLTRTADKPACASCKTRTGSAAPSSESIAWATATGKIAPTCFSPVIASSCQKALQLSSGS